jgi:hypothetical protein
MISLEGNEKSNFGKELLAKNKGFENHGKYTTFYKEKHEIIKMPSQLIKLKPPIGEVSGLDAG